MLGKRGALRFLARSTKPIATARFRLAVLLLLEDKAFRGRWRVLFGDVFASLPGIFYDVLRMYE